MKGLFPLLLAVVVGFVLGLLGLDWIANSASEAGFLIGAVLVLLCAAGIVMSFLGPKILRKTLGVAERSAVAAVEPASRALAAAQDRNWNNVRLELGALAKLLLAWQTSIRAKRWLFDAVIALLLAISGFAIVSTAIKQNGLIQSEIELVGKQLGHYESELILQNQQLWTAEANRNSGLAGEVGRILQLIDQRVLGPAHLTDAAKLRLCLLALAELAGIDTKVAEQAFPAWRPGVTNPPWNRAVQQDDRFTETLGDWVGRGMNRPDLFSSTRLKEVAEAFQEPFVDANVIGTLVTELLCSLAWSAIEIRAEHQGNRRNAVRSTTLESLASWWDRYFDRGDAWTLAPDDALCAHITAITHSLTPYRSLSVQGELGEFRSPERGIILRFLLARKVHIGGYLDRADFRHVELTSEWVTGQSLACLDLRESTFTRCFWQDCDFRGADLRGVKFQDCEFVECCFDETQMPTKSLFKQPEFAACTFHHAIVPGGSATQYLEWAQAGYRDPSSPSLVIIQNDGQTRIGLPE